MRFQPNASVASAWLVPIQHSERSARDAHAYRRPPPSYSSPSQPRPERTLASGWCVELRLLERVRLPSSCRLLVRHEMWVQPIDMLDEGPPSRVLIHYLGDDGFQRMSVPPAPIRVVAEPEGPAAAALDSSTIVTIATDTASFRVSLGVAPMTTDDLAGGISTASDDHIFNE